MGTFMEKSCWEYRNQAWNALGGNWLRAIFSVIGYSVISVAVTFALTFPFSDGSVSYGAASALASFFDIVLCFGLSAIYLGIARREKPSMGTLFAGFSKMFRIVLAGILCAIPPVIFAFVAGFLYLGWIIGGHGLELLLPVLLILTLIGFCIFWTYSLMPLFFVMRDYSECSAWTAIKKSYCLMSGHRFKLFKLHLSFFGWMLLGSITLGIAFFWVGPYMATATAVFYDDLNFTQARPAEESETQT